MKFEIARPRYLLIIERIARLATDKRRNGTKVRRRKNVREVWEKEDANERKKHRAYETNFIDIFNTPAYTQFLYKNFNVNTLLLPRVVTFTRKSMLSFLVTPVRSQNAIFQIVFARKINLLRNDNAKRRSIFF